MTYPKIPAHLSTIRSGNRLGRWTERRAVLVAQRDVRQRWYRTLTELSVEGAPVTVARRDTAMAIDTANARIEECNEAIDALRVTDPAVFARPRRQRRGVGG